MRHVRCFHGHPVDLYQQRWGPAYAVKRGYDLPGPGEAADY
jgi:hypothetical protein